MALCSTLHRLEMKTFLISSGFTGEDNRFTLCLSAGPSMHGNLDQAITQKYSSVFHKAMFRGP